MNPLGSCVDVHMDWDVSTTVCPFCDASPCTGMCLRSPKHMDEFETPNSSRGMGDVSTLHPPAFATEDVVQRVVTSSVLESDLCAGGNKSPFQAFLPSPDGTVYGGNKQELKAAHLLPPEPQLPVKEDISGEAWGHLDSEKEDEDDVDNTTLESFYDNQEITFHMAEGTDFTAGQVATLGSYSSIFVHPIIQNPALAMMRSRVSQMKRRYQRDGFDLDLTYITPRIIAMGFPAWGTEKYYRNPIDEVEMFLESRHKDHYRVYNLCSERLEYDSPRRFKGSCRRFPFRDHNVPCPITLISKFVCDAISFLEEDTSNVVVVHCKAGKGRTGVMISCLLLSLNPSRFFNAEEALRFFDETRTYNGLGVTIPSQRRYVRYYARILREFGGVSPPSRALRLYQITIDSDIKPCTQVEVYFMVEENDKEKIDSRRFFSHGPLKDAKGFVFLFPGEGPVLEGDLRFVFYQRNRLVDSELFYFWVNTSLCTPQEQFSLKNRQLDGRPAKSKDEDVFCKDLSVDVIFVDGLVSCGDGNTTTGVECAEWEKGGGDVCV